MTIRLLSLLNSPHDLHSLVREVTTFLQEFSGCEAVGIRLPSGDDFPYWETRGFPSSFVAEEGSLADRQLSGHKQDHCFHAGNDGTGHCDEKLRLECLCGAVLQDRVNPQQPYFTEYGSFWTNASSKLAPALATAEATWHFRGLCFRKGYQSMALIPLRLATRTIGLLQFNDRRPDYFTEETIAVLERTASSISVALEQRRAQAALHESEEKYRRIVETANDGILYSNEATIIDFVNTRMAEMLGYTPAELIGRRFDVLLFADDLQDHCVRMAARRQGIAERYERRLRHKNGAEICFQVSASSLTDEAGRFCGAFGMFTDITERKRAEAERAELSAQLAQVHKMEAIGRLAGGMAHDFNNVLTVINGYSELILRELENNDPLRESIYEIHQAGQRAAGFIEELLAFSRRQLVEPKRLDLNHVISETRRMLERMVGEDVHITANLAPDLGAVMVDPVQVNRVLMNLAANARDAMPAGGTFTIETRNLELDPASVATLPDTAPGPYVLLEVSDTGIGMDEAARLKIFEPFFTTKTAGKGTGLGMATVYAIVRQSGGAISVESQPGKGSTFRILIPRVPASSLAHTTASVEKSLLHGSETILLAEDQDDVRRLTGRLLKSRGYQVLEANSGTEALALAHSHDGPIHLLLTDVVMPRMTGKELADHLRPLRSETRTIFMSGYPDDVIAPRGVLDGTVAFIPKPFEPEALLRKVRAVLENPR